MWLKYSSCKGPVCLQGEKIWKPNMKRMCLRARRRDSLLWVLVSVGLGGPWSPQVAVAELLRHLLVAGGSWEVTAMPRSAAPSRPRCPRSLCLCADRHCRRQFGKVLN